MSFGMQVAIVYLIGVAFAVALAWWVGDVEPEILIAAPPYERSTLICGSMSIRSGQYRSTETQFAWELYQAGHADGTKEAARRCAEAAAGHGFTDAAIRKIKAGYPEAFKE